MNGQMTIFDFIHEPMPGDYVERFGKRLMFDDLHVGDIVVIDCSTKSHEWYKVVRIEKIFPDAEDGGKIVFSSNTKNYGYISRLCIDREHDAEKIFALWEEEEDGTDKRG